MIKMIIADDERLIRESLNLLMDWGKINVEVIGVAENGKTALELVKKLSPDILLSDISMPQMDGIELMQAVKTEDLKCKIILLSAYSNFAYAQSAVKFGAFDFILKPIDEYELMETVGRCVTLIEKERNAATPSGDEKSGKIIANNVLRGLLFGFAPRSDDERAVLGKLGIDSKAPGSCIGAVFGIHDATKPIPTFAEDCPEGVSENAMTLLDEEQVLLWTTHDKDRAKLAESFFKAARKYDKTLENIFISDPHPMTEVRRIYPECSFARLYPKLGFATSGHRYSDGRVIIDEKYPAVSAEDFGGAIRKKNAAEIKTLTDRLFWRFAQREKIYDLDYMRLKSIECLDDLNEILYISDESAKNTENDIVINAKKLINIQRSVYEVYQAMLSSLMRFCDLIETFEDYKGTRLVSQAVSLIKENYKDVTLAGVAEQLYVSPTYLSRTFAAEKDETFSRYLQKYRMKVAKKLLLDPQYKIYNVAKMVGYSDVAHFSKAFKQIEGVSPMKFKNRAGQSGAEEE